MKLTEQDKKMFEGLKEGAIGKQLVDYFDRLQKEICDVRNLNDKPIESALYASSVIQQISDKIRLQNDKKEKDPNEFV